MPFYWVLVARNNLGGGRQTYLAVFNPDISKSKRRASSESNATVTLAIVWAGHLNFDILKLGDLCDSPVKCREVSASVNSRGVQN